VAAAQKQQHEGEKDNPEASFRKFEFIEKGFLAI